MTFCTGYWIKWSASHRSVLNHNAYCVNSDEQGYKRCRKIDETVLQMDQRYLCCGRLALRHFEDKIHKANWLIPVKNRVKEGEREASCVTET